MGGMAVFRIWFLRFLVFSLAVLSVVARGSVNEGEKYSAQESDRVTNLPGQPEVKFRHYAGYVKVRQQDEKALFYWFFEAEENPSEKPLVLWLNGGPGCSSVAYGAAQELGPFLIRNNRSEPTLNKFAWNKAANLLFLEAPVGVGFSYTNNTEDLSKLGDRVTAEDSHAFLINWFKRFPYFKSNNFYITGESYAGHYVPQLAELIYERNKAAIKDTYINFKGFMIGNAVINDETDETGLIEYAWSHAIISDQLYHSIIKECDFKSGNQTSLCSSSVRGFLEAYSEIDIYSIYTPICLRSDSNSSAQQTYKKLFVAPRTFTQHDLWHKLPSGYDPCTEDYVEKYFNREDVQRALHANVTKLSYPYTPCSDVITRWNDSPDTVLPIIQKLLKAGLRIWIYSGDTDGRVPVTSTRYSVNEMGLKVKEGWRAWFHRKQVAGWVVTYEGGLTLATVRGAGHQVPVFAPDHNCRTSNYFVLQTCIFCSLYITYSKRFFRRPSYNHPSSSYILELMALSSSAFVFSLLFCIFAVSLGLDPETEALQEADLVGQLPSQPPVNFKQYAGYVNVDESYGKALFYWFFEATQKPSEKPLVLWLNGGPGCSSVGFGEAQELGPFLVKKGPVLKFNNYTWNKAANLLFLEAPAGVGFSYSNKTLNTQGDNITAHNSYTFLLNWFKRFPQYKSHEFYIAGESYAGHYVPQLSEVIFDENKKAAKEDYINLKGFIIGNALMDYDTDQNGMIDYAWDHALISDSLYKEIKENCDFSKEFYTTKCNRGLDEYYNLYHMIDMYSLYAPTCPEGNPSAKSDVLRKIPAGYDPCLQNYATTYFNRPDVQEALHANVTKISRPWSLCNHDVGGVWNDSSQSILPIITKLVDGGLRVWVFNGDTDGRIPVTATRYTLNKLGLKITEDWTPWYNHKEVGGWTINYEGGLSFVTVRGAGHQVPTFAPKRSLQLIRHFLANKKLPSVAF
ncbi:Peptidase S10 [Macleaya cordata]|uniref:Carboxypeptidase n=1 Tax=Macleaya cordata TaxID=56857 RepID=A0A200QNM9_MACCD|nr:Peptidase S10 [Macleaya cordata]